MSEDEDRIVKVLLRFEWRAGPWWVSFDDGDVPTDYLPDEITEVLPLSDDLVSAVAEWDERLQSTYVEEQPQDSGFVDPADYATFDSDGRQLAQRVKREVGHAITVVYESGAVSEEIE
ncbi:hypothetical protein [Saccharomonospora halophila]|uniref:hypothetical protein n=1 Tax=Saccharomonospora halophila TaxID=129922 RepID=UPI00037EDAC8|nr:hypothetical protein [Saccharomonospora halophila]